jgi:glycosyltransferase involved in cell wall biosynthesis
MAAGVPTLASATGGLPEYAPAEQLVDPAGDPRRWSEAVEALLHPDAWAEARRRGRAAAEAVLATDPVRAVEDVLLRAATVESPAAPVVRWPDLEARQ